MMYQDLYDRAKMIVEKDGCMKFYNTCRSLYLETDSTGVSLGARLLQVRDGMNFRCDKVLDNATLDPTAFASKSILSAKWCHCNIECEALGIPHGLEKFQHCCFAREVYIITDHKCAMPQITNCPIRDL